MTGDASRRALWSLLAGNFVVGCGVLLPAGMLNSLSADLGVSVATAGLLMLIGGVVVGCGAPLAAAFTSRFDRRKLLAAAMLLYAAGHALSALAPGFASLVAIRAVMIISAAIFTPQAAATVGAMVPPEQRSAAIAFIFIGWSVASVFSAPAGNLIAACLGWRIAYGIVALFALAALALVWTSIRPGIKVEPLSFAAWRAVFANPAIVLTLVVTLVAMSGQFTLFNYMAPVLKGALDAAPGLISLLFLVYGLAGVAGNFFAARLVGLIGLDRAVLAAILSMAAGAACFSFSFGSLPGTIAGLIIWGLGTFSSNSLQQSRLAAAAPALASASIALNTSVLYLGQAIGAGLGGTLIADGASATQGWTAAAIIALAAGVSVAASRLSRRQG